MKTLLQLLKKYNVHIYDNDEEIIAEVEKEYAAQDKWISVEESLPEEEVHVLCFWNDKRIEGAVLTNLDDEKYWYYLQDGDACNSNPTHWMPLPQPPKK